MPGWYPDPAGRPGHFRYWDGSSWSQQTTTTPQTSPAPHQPAQDAGVQPRRGLGWLILIGAVVLALLVWWFALRPNSQLGGNVRPDSNSATPTVSGWDETSTPNPSESAGSQNPQPSAGQMIACPDNGTTSTRVNTDGRLHGGGISASRVPGWTDGGISMMWVDDLQAQTDFVYPGWFSVVGVGALRVDDGFSAPQLSALMMMSCFATSSYYDGFTGRRDLKSATITINGRSGWHLSSEIYVDLPALPQVKGDVVDVIVVDTGDPETLGVFVSSYTIDDTGRQRLVQNSIDSLRVG